MGKENTDTKGEYILKSLNSLGLGYHDKKFLSTTLAGVDDEMQLEIIDAFLKVSLRDGQVYGLKETLYNIRREHDDYFGTCYLCKNFNNPYIVGYNDNFKRIYDSGCIKYNTEVPDNHVKVKNDCPGYEFGGFTIGKADYFRVAEDLELNPIVGAALKEFDGRIVDVKNKDDEKEGGSKDPK